MSEKLRNTPEQEINPEELERIGAERRNELHEALEKKAEHHESLDEARHEALERAQSHEKESKKHESERLESPAERRRGPISKRERDASFQTTMHEVQSQMSGPSRLFSKFIHNKSVEQASEVVGGTVARPNAILSGAIFAFVLTLSVYLVAKNLGYPLSGFETIASFIIGWTLGVAYDFVKVMVTGRK